jgi:hypothetical protein
VVAVQKNEFAKRLPPLHDLRTEETFENIDHEVLKRKLH